MLPIGPNYNRLLYYGNTVGLKNLILLHYLKCEFSFKMALIGETSQQAVIMGVDVGPTVSYSLLCLGLNIIIAYSLNEHHALPLYRPNYRT
jgi:hypothetical protein